ncbi:MAG TPA: outer membrane beta-barrel protein [Saprospiraceae bacterium]|nr:outer membrane beta-barrel protein [Saprospiraceae bacterium]
MKKLILFLLIVFGVMSFQANAQFLVGGNLGFSKYQDHDDQGTNEDETTFTSFTLIPRLGYAFGNSWAGLDAGITSLKIEATGFEDYSSTINLTTINPFYRYIQKPTDNFGIWIEGQAGATFGKDKVADVVQTNYFGLNFGLRPGIIFYFGKKLTFEASFGSFGFSKITATSEADSNNKETVTNFGLGINNTSGILQLYSNNAPNYTPGFQFGVNWMFNSGE